MNGYIAMLWEGQVIWQVIVDGIPINYIYADGSTVPLVEPYEMEVVDGTLKENI